MATDSGQQQPVNTVDGVEPSVEVRYLGNASREDGNESISLFPDDNGAPRSIILGGDPVFVTEQELRQLEASFQIEVRVKGGEWPSDSSDAEASSSGAQDQAAAANAGVLPNSGSSATTPPASVASSSAGTGSTTDTPGQSG